MKHTTLIAGLIVVLAGCAGTGKFVTVDDISVKDSIESITVDGVVIETSSLAGTRTITLSDSESRKEGAEGNLHCRIFRNGQTLLKVSSDIDGLGCSTGIKRGGRFYVQVQGTSDWAYRITFYQDGGLRVARRG